MKCKEIWYVNFDPSLGNEIKKIRPAVIIDDDATLKRVYYYPEDNTIQLIAENPKFKPLIYKNEELDQIRILGKAVYFMSALFYIVETHLAFF